MNQFQQDFSYFRDSSEATSNCNNDPNLKINSYLKFQLCAESQLLQFFFSHNFGVFVKTLRDSFLIYYQVFTVFRSNSKSFTK